ncbi:hypothetical protein MHZ95_17910 [Sporosarcina sp. ACRSM]|uniref:hypothetical protein n=1 Tax=Sporosarcina sp. ACRSM TaxID=2918216 RepID=UPI001EF52BA8|nr:hypothetical protein [Sporosarcina sp. ACRSM]MCG7337138.1 hypothetical protein [Sporosarcina sp. ACRSM]
MKKLLIVFVAMFGLVLAACNGETKEETPEKPGETPQEQPQETQTPEEAPEISKSVIEKAATATKDNMMIEDATAEVKDNTVNLFVTVSDASIDVKYAEETGEEFANLLASNYATENPSASKLWEMYDLKITIGTDKDNPLFEGSKTTDAEKIKW